MLKPSATTGQFGKNHLGDRNEHLPTVHGFDEFYGNLYHLNAEEEPEHPDYPKDPRFRAKFGPRGVLKCKATDKDDETEEPRYGEVGKQKIEDTGPLTKKRMETIDDDVTAQPSSSSSGARQAASRFRVVELDTNALPDAHSEGSRRHKRPGVLQRRDGRSTIVPSERSSICSTNSEIADNTIVAVLDG